MFHRAPNIPQESHLCFQYDMTSTTGDQAHSCSASKNMICDQFTVGDYNVGLTNAQSGTLNWY